MMHAIEELKIKAKRLYRASQDQTSPAFNKLNTLSQGDTKLRHAQLYLAKHLGFSNWQQLSDALNLKSDNFGSIFYPNSVGGLTNEWYRNYIEAKATPIKDKVLLPYKHQWFYADQEYLDLIDLPIELWQPQNDWQLLSTEKKHELLLRRIKAIKVIN